MPIPAGAWDLAGGALGAGASAYGTYMGYKGQKETNAMNMQLAQQQMDFQERMSSTAHQREIKDLRLAGLNPVLSVMGGKGASTPAGAMAQVKNPAEGMGDKLGKTASAFQGFKLLAAQARKAEAEARAADVRADFLDSDYYRNELQPIAETMNAVGPTLAVGGGLLYGAKNMMQKRRLLTQGAKHSVDKAKVFWKGGKAVKGKTPENWKPIPVSKKKRTPAAKLMRQWRKKDDDLRRQRKKGR